MNKSRVSEILSKALVGTGSAREELFTLYRPYLKFVSQGLVGRKIAKRNDSSDVVQQTCADAAASLQEFRGQSEPEFTAWITSILRNKVAEAYRFNMQEKRDVRREVNQAPSDSTASVNWQSISEDNGTPVELVIEGESALFLLHAISGLPEAQAKAVTMRYLDGCKIREIADEMEFTIGKVAGLLRRGIENLRGSLPND